MKIPPRHGLYALEPPLDFLQHLWQLNHALERMSLDMQRRLGVTAQQRLLVRCIGKYPGMTVSQLAAVLHLDRGTVSVGLRRLVSRRLVTRRPDPKDRRRVWLGLTPRGRALDRPDPATVEAAVERLIVAAGPAQIASVKAVLQSLAEDLSGRLTASRPRHLGRRSS